MSRACAACRYWAEREDGAGVAVGECRRRAPLGAGLGLWPLVTGDRWCGEFEQGAVRTPGGEVVLKGAERWA